MLIGQLEFYEEMWQERLFSFLQTLDLHDEPQEPQRMEAENHKANNVPLQKKIGKGKKKKKAASSDDEKPRNKSMIQQEEINRLLAKEVARLRAKNEALKAARPKRQKRPPTAKQMKQWAEFASKVARAKEIYYGQAERSNDAWSRAMSEANQGKPTDADQVLQMLAESGMDPTEKEA
jgi:hypothetical protein